MSHSNLCLTPGARLDNAHRTIILYIDFEAVQAARFINEVRESDTRRYYLIATRQGDAVVVTRNGLALEALARQCVDCRVGWDVATPGFATEEQVGKRRSKVTIFRSASIQPGAKRLTAILNADWIR